jgi:hypothetical protein
MGKIFPGASSWARRIFGFRRGQVWREAGVVAILGFDVPKAVGNSPAKSLPHLRQAIRDDTRMGALGGPARSSHAKAR